MFILKVIKYWFAWSEITLSKTILRYFEIQFIFRNVLEVNIILRAWHILTLKYILAIHCSKHSQYKITSAIKKVCKEIARERILNIQTYKALDQHKQITLFGIYLTCISNLIWSKHVMSIIVNSKILQYFLFSLLHVQE